MDVRTSGGICASSMLALKTAYQSIMVSEHQNAVVCASERLSAFLNAGRFQHLLNQESNEKKLKAIDFFDAAFLRWMLSDGAGAVVLESKPKEHGLSLRIDWIDIKSYANENPTCMSWGTSSPENPTIDNTWLSYETTSEADRAGLMMLRQDVKLLERNTDIVAKHLQELVEAGKINIKEIDHYFPHISSYYFEPIMAQHLANYRLLPRPSTWFTNLQYKGNMGAASIFVILDEAFNMTVPQPKIKAGETILLYVPESGRFMSCFCKLTAFEA